MTTYPDDWAEADLGAAVAALTGAGVEATGTDLGHGVRQIDLVLDGRACRLVERTPKRRHEWVSFDFPWPATWPDISLTAPGEPEESDREDLADPSPPPGHALSSHDLPAARAVVDAGFAAASVDPRADLLIDDFDGAAIATSARVALNATTALWLLDLARRALAAAPPVDPRDHVAGRTIPEFDESTGTVHGTRAEVLHRLLWIARIRHDDDVEAGDADDTAGRLRRSLDTWIGDAARIAADQRAGSVATDEGREQVRQLVLHVVDGLRWAGTDGGERELAERLQAVVVQAQGWGP